MGIFFEDDGLLVQSLLKKLGEEFFCSVEQNFKKHQSFQLRSDLRQSLSSFFQECIGITGYQYMLIPLSRQRIEDFSELEFSQWKKRIKEKTERLRLDEYRSQEINKKIQELRLDGEKHPVFWRSYIKYLIKSLEMYTSKNQVAFVKKVGEEAINNNKNSIEGELHLVQLIWKKNPWVPKEALKDDPLSFKKAFKYHLFDKDGKLKKLSERIELDILTTLWDKYMCKSKYAYIHCPPGQESYEKGVNEEEVLDDIRGLFNKIGKEAGFSFKKYTEKDSVTAEEMGEVYKVVKRLMVEAEQRAKKQRIELDREVEVIQEIVRKAAKIFCENLRRAREYILSDLSRPITEEDWMKLILGALLSSVVGALLPSLLSECLKMLVVVLVVVVVGWYVVWWWKYRR